MKKTEMIMWVIGYFAVGFCCWYASLKLRKNDRHDRHEKITRRADSVKLVYAWPMILVLIAIVGTQGAIAGAKNLQSAIGGFAARRVRSSNQRKG